jgi:hypothetical protein
VVASFEEAGNEKVKVAGKMEANLGIQVERRRRHGPNTGSRKSLQRTGGTVNDPLGRVSTTLHRPPPLNEASLLSRVNLLPASNQTEDNTPAWYTFREFDKMLGLRFRGTFTMLLCNPVPVPGTLCLVEDKNVFGWNTVPYGRIALDVILHAPDKCLSSTSRLRKFILKYLNKGSIPREKHSGCCRLAVRTRLSEVIEVVGVDDLKSNQGFPGPRHSSQKDETARAAHGSLVDNASDLVNRWLGCRTGSVDPS